MLSGKSVNFALSLGERVRPVLKWPGGKRRLLGELKNNLPSDYEDRVFVEPFFGGGALFFELEPPAAIILDANPALMGLYGVIRSRAQQLIEQTKRYENKNTESDYYQIREKFNLRKTFGVDEAAQFLYLNRTCFNGLYRVNRFGEFNVPFGSYKNPELFSEAVLLSAQEVLRHARLYVGDFLAALQFCEGDEFVYMDPPYHSDGTGFTSYVEGGFGEKRQRQVAKVFSELSCRGCKVMASNADTPLIRSLYRGFSVKEVSAPRSIAAKGSVRKRVRELLICNY